MKDAKLKISIQSRTLVMGKSIHDAREGTFPKSTQDGGAHLTTGKVPSVGVDVSQCKHGGGGVRKNRRRRQSQSSQRFKFTPERGDGNVHLAATGRLNAKDRHVAPSDEHVQATKRAQPPLGDHL